MTRFIRILASVALTAAGTPLAAYAMTAPLLNQMQTQPDETVSSALPKAPFVVAQVQSYADPPFVQSGSGNQKYPESIGG
ncbi:MAG TPA: hypothetical protein VL356_03400 [Acidocella sp.]|jgi:hypothetical protein|nr:hypothetical protein [Acidocella sp.]